MLWFPVVAFLTTAASLKVPRLGVPEPGATAGLAAPSESGETVGQSGPVRNGEIAGDVLAALSENRWIAGNVETAGGPAPAAKKEVLLVLVGILKDFPRTWEQIERYFLAPNEAAGYRFTLGIHTSLSCSCGPPLDPVAEASPGESRLEALRAVLGPRGFWHMDAAADSCLKTALGGREGTRSRA